MHCGVKIGKTDDGYWLGVAALPIGHGTFAIQEIVWEKPIRKKLAVKIGHYLRPYIRKMLEDYKHSENFGASGNYNIGAVSEYQRSLARDYAYQGKKRSLRHLENLVRRGKAPKWLLRWAHNKRLERAGISYRIKKKKGWFAKAWGSIKRVAGKVTRFIKETADKIGRIKIIRFIDDKVGAVGRFLGKVYKHPLFESIIKAASSAIPGLGPIVAKAYDLGKKAIDWIGKITDGSRAAINAAAKAVKLAKAGHKGAKQLVNRLKNANTLIKKVKRAAPKVNKRYKLPSHLESLLC